MMARATEASPEHIDAIINAIPARRLGRPEEIASAVLWLCSLGAGFSIGHALSADGGLTIQ
jgi:NAD(P)-dependent dehydrogenase (short-subunit alcohol dehydrogenase family)